MMMPPKDLKVHSGTPVTHGGLQRQHQRKVKNTQSYEFYYFPKNGRMQCGLSGTPAVYYVEMDDFRSWRQKFFGGRLSRLVISSETRIARKEAARSTLAVFCSIPANGGCVRLGRLQPAWSLQEARRPSGAARERRCARRGAEPTQNSPARDIGGLFDRRLGV